MEEGEGERGDGPIFRDIRRYYCEFCGICRSKKSLITSHVLSHHQEQIKEQKVEEKGKEEGVESTTCEECGASFRKPAYLKQHMSSHSVERTKMASSSQFIPTIVSGSSTSSSSSSSDSSSDEDRETVSQRYNKKMRLMMNLLPVLMLPQLLQPVGRLYIQRDREGSHRQLWQDYFAENCTYPPDYFRRRYRMRRELFLRILEDIKAYDQYFVQKKNCRGRLGCSSIQKLTTAIRILAYGLSADYCDEYLKIGESTTIKSLKRFCGAVIALYEGHYMRSPNEHDVAHLLQDGEERGFPGMLGSLDCMHWEWKNCPTEWHDTHEGHYHKPTLILEAVASKDLWIWHSFFGMAGSHNDVNVLDHSPLFDNLINGRMPHVNYEVNGRQYTLGYYLTDDIYPHWATLIQTIAHPTTKKERLFAQKQEAVRKDVERAFGVLQIKWGITQGPARYWKKDDLCNIMKTCIILHNMIIEDERGTDVEIWRPLPEENISPPEYSQNPTLLEAHISSRLSRICNRGTNTMLRSDLIDYLWKNCGDNNI